MLEKICDLAGEIIALVIKPARNEEGVNFFTAPEWPMQVARMSHKKGHIIPAHTHNARSSHINTTTEVLIVESGRLATTLYSKNHEFIDTRVLEGGDIIVIMSGGHSFEVIENCIFFEVKQGPFDPTNDKTLFG